MKKLLMKVVLWAAVIVGTVVFVWFKIREYLPGKAVVVDPTQQQDQAVDDIVAGDTEVTEELEEVSQSIANMTKEEVISEFKKAFGVSPTQPNGDR